MESKNHNFNNSSVKNGSVLSKDSSINSSVNSLKPALKAAAQTKAPVSLPSKSSLNNQNSNSSFQQNATILTNENIGTESVSSRIRSLSVAMPDIGSSVAGRRQSATAQVPNPDSLAKNNILSKAEKAQLEAERLLPEMQNTESESGNKPVLASNSVLDGTPSVNSRTSVGKTSGVTQASNNFFIQKQTLTKAPLLAQSSSVSTTSTSAMPVAENKAQSVSQRVTEAVEANDDESSQDEKRKQLLKRTVHEFEQTVREAFQIVEREMAVERRRRQLIEYRWLKELSNVEPKTKRNIRRDWRQMDRVFLARKREMLESVGKNFEAKFLFAVGSKTDAKTLLKDNQLRIFNDTIYEYIRRHTKAGDLDEAEQENVFKRLCSETLEKHEYIKKSHTLEGLNADSDSSDEEEEDDNASGASTPLHYEFSFTSLDNVMTPLPSIPLAQATAISSNAIVELNEPSADVQRVLETTLDTAFAASEIQNATFDHASAGNGENIAATKPKDEIANVQETETKLDLTCDLVNDSLKAQQREEAAAPRITSAIEIDQQVNIETEALDNKPVRASIVMETVIGGSSSSLQCNSSSKNSGSIGQVYQKPITAEPISIAKPDSHLNYVKTRTGAFCNFYPDTYDEIFLKEVIIPEILSIVEENHVMRASKILPYLLPAKSSPLKRMFTFWKPNSSTSSNVETLQSSSSAQSQAVFQNSTSLVASSNNLSNQGNTNSGGALKSLGRRLTLARKSFSASSSPVVQSPPADAAMSSGAGDPSETVEKGQIFSTPLDEVCNRDMSSVPLIVLQCISYLEEHGMNTPGLFRVTASSKKIEQFCAALESGQDPFRNGFVDTCGPHVVAGVLKLFIRELPDPLLSGRMWKVWLKIGNIQDSVLRLRLTRLLVTVIPSNSRHTLRAVVSLLKKIKDNAGVTLMDAKNLATCIGPTICRPPSANKPVNVSGNEGSYSPLSSDKGGAVLSPGIVSTANLESMIEGDVVMYKKVTLLIKTIIDQADFLFVLPEGILSKYSSLHSSASLQSPTKRQTLQPFIQPLQLSDKESASPISVPLTTPFDSATESRVEKKQNSELKLETTVPAPVEMSNAAEKSVSLSSLNSKSPPPVNPPSPAFLARSNSSLKLPSQINSPKSAFGSVQLSSSVLNNGSSLKNLLSSAEPEPAIVSTSPAPAYLNTDASGSISSPKQPMQRRKTLKQRIGAKLGFSN